MAYPPLSSLLRRSSSSPILRPTLRCLPPARRTSTSAASPKSTLSARMSFVFDQIDAIERERNEKDETLRRIRAWREKKHRAEADDQPAAAAAAPSPSRAEVAARENVLSGKEVELVHPWPEWVEFMELLMRQNYFDHRRRDESRSIPNLVDGGDDGLPLFSEEGIDFTRDFATVRTACVNFGRDRFDILRSAALSPLTNE